MAKAKFTQKGNIQVTMSPDQYTAVMAVLSNVRLGINTDISGLMADLEPFNYETGLDEDIEQFSQNVTVSIEQNNITEFTIDV